MDHGYKLADEYHTVTSIISVGNTATGPFIDVQPDLQLRDVRPLGVYMIFDVQKPCELDSKSEQSTPASDAFSLLMNNARKKGSCLPEVLNETDNFKKMENKFRELLSMNKIGWSKNGDLKYGISLINTVSECLCYLDGHHETLKAQSCQLPVELSHL